MIETIGPVGHTGGRPTTLAACVTFMLGALAGGVVTFGALGALGGLVHGAGGRLAYALAAAMALAAALAEARGTAIVPQVRRQLPEHWRRVMPMPIAAGLYGVLLGLGFTTFVLTFGVFALAGIVSRSASPRWAWRSGSRSASAGRCRSRSSRRRRRPAASGYRGDGGPPGDLPGFRVGDGVALLGAAAALAVTAPATASKVEAQPAADPAAAGEALVFQRPDGSGVLRRDGRETALPGHDPAVGQGRVAVVRTAR